MKIPNGPEGTPAEAHPTISNNQIQTYGAGSVDADGLDTPGGCPLQWKARYVDGYREPPTVPMLLGSALHLALYAMEEHAIGPEEALEQHWPPELGLAQFVEARSILEEYLDRGGPMNRYGTLAVELDLVALLYVDEDHGPVYFRGIIDHLGVDVNLAQTIHVTDYKNRAAPPSQEEVDRDPQLLGYDWLVRENWNDLGLVGTPRTVVHLDALRWRDLATRHSAHQIEEWRAWAEAIARRILRDDKAEPVLNPGCARCPIRLDCPAYRDLPNAAAATLPERSRSSSIEELWEWAQAAKALKAKLDAGIRDVLDMIEAKAREARANGEETITVGDTPWSWTPKMVDKLDKARLREILGDEEFARLARFTKKELNEWARQHARVHAVRACWASEPDGSTLKMAKTKGAADGTGADLEFGF